MTSPQPSRTRDVHVGGALLRVDGEAATTVRPAARPEEAQLERLADAVGDLTSAPSALEQAEELRETGEAVTVRAEQVKEALELLLHGGDVEQVIHQLDGWVGAVHRRYADGDYEAVIRLARLLTGVLVLALRWHDLVAVLGLGVAAAQRVGDLAAEAWALRELGRLAAVAGDEPLATELLSRASDQYERAGDHGGAERAPIGQPVTSGRIRSAVVRMARRKLAAGSVTAAIAGLALFLLPGEPDAEIVAFTTSSSKNPPGARDEHGGQRVPATAVEPGGVIRACDPLYLVAYVRYSDMSRGTRVVSEATVPGEFSARSAFRWSGPEERTSAGVAFVRSEGGPAVSSGEPVPAGRWTYTLTLDGHVRDEATVTLRNSCP